VVCASCICTCGMPLRRAYAVRSARRQHPWSRLFVERGEPISTATRLPSCARTPFHKVGPPRSVSSPPGRGRLLARHSGGRQIGPAHVPAARSSRSYPTILRNASLASMTFARPAQMKIPDDVIVDQAPDFRLAFRTSRYKRAFSSAIAACEASSSHRDPRPA